VNAVAELLGQAAAELRRDGGPASLQAVAARVERLVRLLRRAGEAHGVPLPTEVLAGISTCTSWAAHLADRAKAARTPPTRAPADGARVVGMLLDQATTELAGDAATVTVLAAGASKLADLLATARQVAQERRVRPPAELAGMIHGLNAWALYLAASSHGVGDAAGPSGGQ
jgi:hypothetical protein